MGALRKGIPPRATDTGPTVVSAPRPRRMSDRQGFALLPCLSALLSDARPTVSDSSSSPLSRPCPWVVSASLDLACARASSVRRVPGPLGRPTCPCSPCGAPPARVCPRVRPPPPRVFRPVGRIGRHLSSVGGALPAFRPSVAPACFPLAATGARPGRRRTGALFPGVRAPRVAFPVGSGFASRLRVFSARACRFALASLPMRLVLAAKEHLASLKNRVWLRPSGT